MAIKFPQNIEEYTNGKLWYDGIDESVARRILFSLNQVEDKREMRLRKTYLAHFYCEREDYRLAINLCKQLILQYGVDKEILLLMQYCCMRCGDVSGIGEVLGGVKLLSEEDREDFMSNFETEEFPPEVFFSQPERKKGTKVELKDGWTEYYSNNKLIFKCVDNDYVSFMKDNAARRLLSEGDAIGAIAQLDSIVFRRIKRSTEILCHQTYVNAFLELGEHLNCYSHCKIFIDENMYIDAMLPLLEGLRQDGYMSQYEELRRFIASLKDYDISQLTNFFDFSDETGDFAFWEMLEENNPLDKLRESDERLCLEGRAYERNGDAISAQKCWRKAVAIYGQFSRANFYLRYPKLFSQAEERLSAEYGESDSKSLDNAAKLSEYCKDIVATQIENWKSKSDLSADCEEKTKMLSIAICDFYIDIDRLSHAVGRMYESGLVAIVDEIDRIALNDDVNDVNRAICLANYLLSCESKEVFLRGEKCRNVVAELKGERNNAKYGIAMFAAHAMIRLRADANGLKKVYGEVKRFYSMIVDNDSLKPYVVYAFLLEYYANLRLSTKHMPNYLVDIEELICALIDNCGNNIKDEELNKQMLMKLYSIKKRLSSIKNNNN